MDPKYSQSKNKLWNKSQQGVKGSRPGRTGVTRLPRSDTGGLTGALAILQGR